MPAIDESAIAIAGVYAESLLELTQTEQAADDLLAEMAEFGEYLDKDAKFREFLSSPAVDDDVRRESLERMFRGRMSDLLLNTLHVLNDKWRTAIVSEVFEQFRLKLSERRKQVEVQVTTAVALPKKLRIRLQEVLGVLTGCKVGIVERVDETIIGGVVVQIGDRKIDASINHRIRQIHDVMSDRAAREIHSDKHYFDEVSS